MDVVWTEAFHIFTDVGHLVAEIAFEIVFMVITLVVNWIILKYRDRRHGHK